MPRFDAAMKRIPALLIATLSIAVTACDTIETPQRTSELAARTENFNREWRFTKGEQRGAEALLFDDSAWQSVRLPHDWAISGPYDPNGVPHTGKLPWKGEGWYRKTFWLPPSDDGQRVYLDFDGVMAMHEVQFTLSGPATIAGVGNGDHHFPAEFDTDHVALFYGKAMLILRTIEASGGSIEVLAHAEGLQSGNVTVRSR